MAELGELVMQGYKKYTGEVTLEMMDYTYVDKCDKIEELRAIFSELKKGECGRYPHLENHVEKRILSLMPAQQRAKFEAMSTAPSPSEESAEARALSEWGKSQTAVDSRLRSEVFVSKSKPKLPPPRGAAGKNYKADKEDQGAPVKIQIDDDDDDDDAKEKVERIHGYDFRSWDKYDVDSECAKLDDAEKRKEDAVKAAKARSQALQEKRRQVRVAELEDLRAQLGVESRSAHERDFIANREKAKGNEAYRAGEVQAAYEAYSRSLAFTDSAVVYANRAMACIKLDLHERAEDDCTASLRLDPTFTKALARRAMTRHRRGKYTEAIADLEEVLKAQPDNQPIRKLLVQSRAKLREVQGTEADHQGANFVRVAVQEDDDSEDEDVPVRVAIADDDDDDEEDVPVRVAIADDDDDDEEDVRVAIDDDEAPSSTGGVKVAIEDDDDDSEEDEAEASSSTGVKVAIEEDDSEEEEEPVVVSSGVKVAIEEDEDPVPSSSSLEEAPKPEEPLEMGADGTFDIGSSKGEAAAASSETSPSSSSSASWEQVATASTTASMGASFGVSAERFKALGNEAMTRGDLAEAEARYTEALEADPSHLAAQSNRVLARLRLEKWAEAEADATAVLNSPSVEGAQRVKALFRRGSARHSIFKQKQETSVLDSALDDLRSAVALEPTNEVAVAALDGAEKDREALKKAASSSSSTKSVRASSDEAKARGTAAMQAGDLETADREYTRAVEVDETNLAARNNRALVRLKLERHAEAREDATVVLAAEPDNAKALYRRAVAARNLDDIHASLRDLDHLLELEPRNKAAANERTATLGALSAKRTKTAPVSLKDDADQPPPPPPFLAAKKEEPAGVQDPKLPPQPPTADAAPRKTRVAVAKDATAARKLVAKRNVAKVPKEPPKTAYELERVWRELRTEEGLRAKYVASFDRLTLKKITSPSQELFDEVLKAVCALPDAQHAATILKGAAKSKTFAVNRAMLGVDEIAAVKGLLARLEGDAETAARDALHKAFFE